MPGKQYTNKNVAAYIIDLERKNPLYTTVEGVGKCRRNFANLVADLEKGDFGAVVVARAAFLFVDTSPMWMEKFIATVKRYHILVIDATSQREYDLCATEDELTFRAEGKNL